MSSLPRFDVAGNLPIGRTTLLEASAGTGKTYALTALAVRFVAEADIPIGEILLVTFTRAATAELRERIRARLVECVTHLDSLADDDTSGSSGDPLLDLLAAGTDDQRCQRRDRLQQAVRDYDTATISTIHGFCSQIRASLGVLAEQNPDAIPTESEAELIRQVASDVLFTRASNRTTRRDVDGAPVPLPELDTLCAAVKKARMLGDCVVQAESGRVDDVQLVELIDEVRCELDERLRRLGGLSFDSLVASARDAVCCDPDLVASLRSRFKVALVDEFQDTDPAQWDIFRTVFGDHSVPDPPTLVLVGDPKQAIYSFRGGDVYAYLSAKDSADVMVLGVNQRSDAAAVDAMNALAVDQAFGEERIAYERVDASPRHRGRQLCIDDQLAPGVDLRLLTEPSACQPGLDKFNAGAVRQRIAADLADRAVELLERGEVRHDGAAPSRITPGDVAVLLPARSEAQRYETALKERGIPAILRLGDNVADSPAAEQWRLLLHALDRPASASRAAAVALGWWFRWEPSKVAAAVDAPAGDDAARELIELQHRLVGWADRLRSDGVAALFGDVRRGAELVPRMLATASGERDLTDVEHLAELLHAATHPGGGAGGTTAAAALAALDDLAGTADDEVAIDAVQRRIESEADAVQIMTIHGSKGLEFPVVLLPELWSGGKRVQAGDDYSYFDREQQRRVLDVSTKFTDPNGDKDLSKPKAAPHSHDETKRQNCGDQHRLTYVALTRAVHQSVVWWVPNGAGHKLTGLARMIAHTPKEHPADREADLPAADRLVAELEGRFADVPELRVSSLGPVGDGAPTTVDTPGPDVAELQRSGIGRRLARDARRWSFTSLSKEIRGGTEMERGDPDPLDDSAGDAGARDEHVEAPTVDDEPAASTPATRTGLSPKWSQPSPFEGLGGGTGFGNLVHHLLEVVDFDGADPVADITAELERTTRHPVSDVQRERLPEALAEVLRTPLGDRFGNICLADLDRSRRLDELSFHLPLSPNSRTPARRIGALLRDHLPADDPLLPWAERLARGLERVDLQGELNGAVDLVLVHGAEAQPRFSVVDYKTNRLGAGTTRTLADYHPDVLHRPMAHSHYALQCLLYSVALHRFLRWRLAGYDPAVHLGPVGYLFVRGMIGPDTPIAADGPNAGVPAGVFTWELPAGLVPALSDLLAGMGAGDPSEVAS